MERVCKAVVSDAGSHDSHEAQAHVDLSIRPGNARRTSGLRITHDIDQHRATIKQLFIDEKRPLVQVMEIMNMRYNVTASKKVYKTRLKKWNLSKNVRLPQHGQVQEDQDLLRQLVTEDKSYRPEGYRLVNGQLIEVERLVAYLQRRLRASSGHIRNLHAVPIPIVVKPPDTLYASETVVLLIRNYLRGQYGDTVNTPRDLHQLRLVQPANNTATAFAPFIGKIEFALKRNHLTQALVDMRQAPLELTTLMQNGPFDMLGMLCWFITAVTSSWSGHPAEQRQLTTALRALIRYTATYATNPSGLGLHSSHPLVNILQAFLAINDDTMGYVALKGWAVSNQTSHQLLDQPSPRKHGLDLDSELLPPDVGDVMVDAQQRFGHTGATDMERRQIWRGDRMERRQTAVRAHWYYAAYMSTLNLTAEFVAQIREEQNPYAQLEALRHHVMVAQRSEVPTSADIQGYCAKVGQHGSPTDIETWAAPPDMAAASTIREHFELLYVIRSALN